MKFKLSFVIAMALLFSAPSLAATYTTRHDCGIAIGWPQYITFYASNFDCRLTLTLDRTQDLGTESYGNVTFTVENNGTFRGRYHRVNDEIFLDFDGKTYGLFRSAFVRTDSAGNPRIVIRMSTSRDWVYFSQGDQGTGGGGVNPGKTLPSNLEFDLSQISMKAGLWSLDIRLTTTQYGSLLPALKSLDSKMKAAHTCLFEDKLAPATCMPLFKSGLVVWEAFVPEFYAVHAQHGLEGAKKNFTALAQAIEKVHTSLKKFL